MRAIVTETVFGLPGIGTLRRLGPCCGATIPVIQGALIAVAALYVLINLTVDLICRSSIPA